MSWSAKDGGENKCPEKSQDFFSRVRTGMRAHSGLCNRIPVCAIGKKDKIFGTLIFDPILRRDRLQNSHADS